MGLRTVSDWNNYPALLPVTAEVRPAGLVVLPSAPAHGRIVEVTRFYLTTTATPCCASWSVKRRRISGLRNPPTTNRMSLSP
jgi:hypothetical protein